ncbi:MAG: anticodon nuclease, partial [Ignavibacteriaceae bacterium]|nr:anticodon nuclease [Ignavibacteriaceae bacterium]
MSREFTTYSDLEALVIYLRSLNKKYTLLFAYNGTGKTRLSMDFRQVGKKFDKDGNVTERDTLYFNAFTEDLFYWDNDLLNDAQRVLKFNKDSRFFDGLQELEMDNKIRPLLNRYSNFNFLINYEEGSVKFIREELVGGKAQNIENIKVSRGE